MGILNRPPDRRASPRRPLDQVAPITAVTINSEPVKVIDISRGGLLAECGRRSSVQGVVRLKLVGGPSMSGSIVRCKVAALSAESVIYQVAVAFERPLSLVDDEREIGDSRTLMDVIAAAVDVTGRVDTVAPELAFALNSW